MNWLKSSILAVAATASLGANAGLLTITDGAVSNVPGNNFFFPTPDGPDGRGVNEGLSYNIGGQLSLTKDAHLTYTYLGKEAGYWNKFSAGGHSIVTQGADKKATKSDGSVGITLNNVLAGVLDFSFATNGDWDAIDNSPERSGTVSNSDAVRTASTSESAPRLISFAILLNQTYNGVFYDALLMFDDAGPGYDHITGLHERDDDNHDDMLIGLRAVAVPAPAAVLLMGLGLLGLGAARRRS